MKHYLVNILQATVAADRKARIHKICENQPTNCRLSEIERREYFDTLHDAETYCVDNMMKYKHCSHCLRIQDNEQSDA